MGLVYCRKEGRMIKAFVFDVGETREYRNRAD